MSSEITTSPGGSEGVRGTRESTVWSWTRRIVVTRTYKKRITTDLFFIHSTCVTAQPTARGCASRDLNQSFPHDRVLMVVVEDWRVTFFIDWMHWVYFNIHIPRNRPCDIQKKRWGFSYSCFLYIGSVNVNDFFPVLLPDFKNAHALAIINEIIGYKYTDTHFPTTLDCRQRCRVREWTEWKNCFFSIHLLKVATVTRCKLFFYLHPSQRTTLWIR